MGTRGIRVGKQRIREGTREITMETRRIKVEMRGMGVGMRGIRVILCENFCVITSAKILEQLPDNQSHVFCLVYQVDEFSFKEMRKFLCFFGFFFSLVLNITMLIQILFYQNCKHQVRSRIAILSMICYSSNLSVREIN